MQVTATLTHAEDGGYVAYDAETGTTSEGETIDQALINLREAVKFYREAFPINFGTAPLITTVDEKKNA